MSSFMTLQDVVVSLFAVSVIIVVAGVIYAFVSGILSLIFAGVQGKNFEAR